MIAVFTLLFLVGALDLIQLVMPASKGVKWCRIGVALIAVLVVGAMVPVIILGDFLTAAGVILGFSIWCTTYSRHATPQLQILALSGLLAVVLWLLWPVIRMHLPGITHSASFVFPNDWAEYMWVLAALSVLLINLATANRIVRMVLDLVHTRPAPAAAPMDRGQAPPAGRFIGALERILLVVLLLAGQGVSIAGIAAAKGIIRYPEISKTVREEGRETEETASGKIPHHAPGLSAEIFFIGTITSWLIAFATVGLVVLAARI